MKLNKITADMVSRRPDQTAEWLNRLARQVDIVETDLGSMSKKPWDLPIATTYSLGVIKVGQNLSITPEGVLSALAPASYDYTLLFNKPKINNVELVGDKSLHDLGIDIPTSYWGQSAVGGVVGGTITLTDGGKTATISTTGHNSSLAGISIGNASNYIEAGITTTSVVSNTGNVNIKPKSGSSVDVFNAKIINLANPTNNNDAANKKYVDDGLATKQDMLIAGSNINIASDGKTISAVVPTQTSDIVNNGADGTSTYVEADELATVATSGSYSDLLNKPTIGNATLTIQKNGTSAGTFTANATSNKTINITVPTTAADVGALPDSTKYAANLSLTIDSSTFVVTGQLKDQDGNNLGSAQTVDLPLESVVVSGSYDSATKEVVLVLENGSEIRFSVADLVSGLQSEITSANPLDADLVDDSTSTNKFVTATDIAKLNGIQAGAEVNVQSNWTEADSTSDAYILNKPSLATVATSGDYNDLSNKPTIGNATLTIQKNGTNVQTFTANATSNKTANITVPTKTSDITNDGADGTSTYVENDDLTTALAGKQDTLTAGTNINLVSNTISTQTRGIEYIVGTQASTTNLWTGVSTDNGCSSGTLYVGKTIAYYLPVAGNSSAATLNLTLPDGTTTGGIALRRQGGSSVTSHFGANNVILMTYDGTYWKVSAYYDSNSTQQLRNQNNVIAAAAITDNRLTCGTSAGYKMVAANETYDINYPLLWFNAGANLASGARSNAFYRAVESRNLRNNKANWTGAQYTMTYLFGTLSGDTLTIDPDVFTQTVPTTEDGKVYTPIGLTYNSTYQIYFFSSNVYYAYKNGEFRPISHSDPVMTGASSGTAGAAGLVPAPAAGDDTKFLSGDGLWKTVSQYSLPIATANDLGGIKVGSRLTINSTTGVLSADSQTDNNFTTTLKDKLDGIAAGAEVNVQADWNEASNTSDAYIKNKPSLATVATSGSYNDLTNKPTIPTVNNATLTIQKNSTNVATFTANASSNVTANISVPTKTSELTNDSGFITTETEEIFYIDATNIDFANNTFTSSKTFEEIWAAINDGQLPVVRFHTGSADYSETAIAPLEYHYADDDASEDYISFIQSEAALASSAYSVAGLSNTFIEFDYTRDRSTTPATYTYYCNRRSSAITSVSAVNSSSTNTQVPGAKLFYDTMGAKADTTTAQSFAAQEGSTNPVFDDMTPIKTFTWTVTDTTYRPVYQFDNTGWDYGNMDITVAYRITVTGTGISQTTDIVDRWFSPGSWPVTSIMARTLSTSAATTGYRYLRAVYPVSAYLNNNTYKLGQEIAAYNSTSRTVKVEVFKTNSLVTWNETKPAGTIYQGSTYQRASSLEPYGTRGWIFRKPADFVATSADQATAISDYERYSPGSSALKSGASALVAGHFAFLAEDGLVYDISNTAKAISVGESKVGWIASGVNANTAINQTYWRMISRPNATQYGYFSHDTMALGDRVYLRCTMDSSGKIHSDNYLAKSMSPGYTWMPMGFMTAATTFYADTRFPKFYTLDADGNMTHMDGIPLISYANGNSISY